MSTDKELDDYLKGGSELSRAYADADDIAPPAHLDAAILAQAHRAVYARPAVVTKRRWAMPLGLVATVFIMVMAGLQLPAMMKDDALMQAPQVASVAMERNLPMPTSVAPEPVTQAESKLRARKTETTNETSKKMAAATYAKQDADKVAMAAAPVAAPAPAAPSVAMSDLADLRSTAKINEVAALEERQAMASGQVSAAPAARMAATPVIADQLLKAKDATLNPEDWLKQIKALQQADKLEEAKKELVAFKKRYPDYQIPKAMEMP
ncbi:MAG: hypothetical protein ABL856_12190 [Gallionella sp.]